MALSLPYSQYTPSLTKMVRFVYVSGALKPYVVCLISDNGSYRFAYKQVDSSDFSATFVPIAIGNTVSFGVIETNTPWYVGFLYNVSGTLKYMVVNFQDNTIVTAPSTVSEGTSESIDKIITTMVQIYVRNQNLYGKEIGGIEQLVNDASAYFISDYDTAHKEGSKRLRYIGTQVEKAEISLTFDVDVDTTLLWRCWNSDEIPYTDKAYDTFLGDYDLEVNTSGLVRTGITGKIEECFKFPFISSGYIGHTEPIVFADTDKIALSFWQNSGSQLPGSYDAYIIQVWGATSASIQVDLPSSGGDLVFRSGTDSISKAISAGEYQGSFTHWFVQKNVATGVMEVWRNAVLWHNDTGKTAAFENAQQVTIGLRWQGLIDDVGLINDFLTSGEITDVYDKGVAGLALSSVEIPGLLHYWKMDATAIKLGIRDQADNSGIYGDAHLICEDIQPITDYGVQFTSRNPLSFIWVVPNEITIECKFVALCNARTNYLIDGNVWLLYRDDGSLRFGFIDSNNDRHEYTEEVRQGATVFKNQVNHVAIVHKFGDKTTTKLIINGIETEGKWRSDIPYAVGSSGSITAYTQSAEYVVVTTSASHGLSNNDVVEITGSSNYNGIYIISDIASNTFKIIHTWHGDDGIGSWNDTNVDNELAGGVDPYFSIMYSDILLGDGDILVGMKVSDVLKTPAEMLSYVRGRTT